MIKQYLSKICQQLDPSLCPQLHGDDVMISRVVTDSRGDCGGALFVALKGPHFDAHEFLSEVVDKKAAAVLVEHRCDLDLPQILVSDTKLALGGVAKNNRQLTQAQFIAITGSSGKTTVKEMVLSILQNVGETFATKGNFNNEIGAPLSLLEMNENHRFGVIELGASQAGEIAYTAGLTQPDVALINNVAAAHLQGFGDLHGVARAKGEIYSALKADGIAIINNDDQFADFWKRQLDRPMISFSVEGEADLVAKNIQLNSEQCASFELHYQGKQTQLQLPLAGGHNVNNAMAAAACCVALGISLTQIKKGLSQSPVVTGRLMTEQLENGCRLIDDTYNANLSSMKAAIDLLAKYEGRKILVIGDMAELGEFGRQCHEQVGQMARDAKIDSLYSCGVLTQFAHSVFLGTNNNHKNSQQSVQSQADPQGHHFSNQQLLIQQLKQEAIMDTTILIKGSRSAHMENVVMALMDDADGQTHGEQAGNNRASNDDASRHSIFKQGH